MNKSVVKNAIGTLDKLLSEAKNALAQVEREVFNLWNRDNSVSFEYPREAMAEFLQELHDVLLVVLEAAEMPEARTSLIKEWDRDKRAGVFAVGPGINETRAVIHTRQQRSPRLHTIFARRTKGRERRLELRSVRLRPGDGLGEGQGYGRLILNDRYRGDLPFHSRYRQENTRTSQL